MSCLTRHLQKQLCKYIANNQRHFSLDQPDQIRHSLIQQGICPTNVTTDQVSMLIEAIRH